MRKCIPRVNSNWRGAEAKQWELCSETLISVVRLRCQVGAEEICEQASQKGR